MGPQEARLRAAVAGARREHVDTAQLEWQAGSQLLEIVARALEHAAPHIENQFGSQTGPAAAAAFQEVAAKVDRRSTEMKHASDALLAAGIALSASEDLRDSFDRNPLSEPTKPTQSPGPSTRADVDAQRQYDTDKAQYDADVATRESQARTAADHMDTVYGDSTETMKKIHGEPDRAPTQQSPTGPVGSGGGGGGGGGDSRSSTPSHHTTTGGQVLTASGGTHSTSGTSYTPHQPGGTVPSTHGTSQGGTPIGQLPSGTPGGVPTSAVPTGSSSTGGVSGATAGGLAGAIGGGALGGMTGIGGAVRGPMAVPTGSTGGTGASSGRIGSSSRTAGAVRGALGRSNGLAGETVSGGRGTGAASGGRSTGSGTRSAGGGTRGAGGAGARGQAGGRGSAGGGQGGRNRKDPKKKGIDFFEEEQDWVDDEDVAPGVID